MFGSLGEELEKIWSNGCNRLSKPPIEESVRNLESVRIRCPS